MSKDLKREFGKATVNWWTWTSRDVLTCVQQKEASFRERLAEKSSEKRMLRKSLQKLHFRIKIIFVKKISLKAWDTRVLHEFPFLIVYDENRFLRKVFPKGSFEASNIFLLDWKNFSKISQKIFTLFFEPNFDQKAFLRHHYSPQKNHYRRRKKRKIIKLNVKKASSSLFFFPLAHSQHLQFFSSEANRDQRTKWWTARLFFIFLLTWCIWGPLERILLHLLLRWLVKMISHDADMFVYTII